jgi:hypothetical protein
VAGDWMSNEYHSTPVIAQIRKLMIFERKEVTLNEIDRLTNH